MTGVFPVWPGTVAPLKYAAAAASAQIYVSPDGDDLNGDGSLGKPYRTIAKAQQVMRTIKPAAMTGDIEIILRGGTYELENTLTLTSADSGNNGHYVIFRAYPGETPVISGGIKLTGWAQHQGNIYKTAVDDGFDTRHLFVNGVRAVRARSEHKPNGFSKNTAEKAFNLPSSGPYADMANWRNKEDMELLTTWSWKHTRLAVKDVVYGQIQIEPKSWDFGYTQAQFTGDAIEYIENAYELLDEPGEWYLDKSANEICYIPRPGEDLATAEVIAGKLEQLVVAQGTAANPVENIIFDGLTFAYSTWLLPNGELGYPDFQTGVIYAEEPWVNGQWFTVNYQTPAALEFWHTKNSIIRNSVITGTGNAGVALREGSSGNLITRNVIRDTSGNGINVGEITLNAHKGTPAEGIVKDNTVSFNTITRVGAEYFDNAGIFAGYTQNLVIDHNDVFDVPHIGISAGWGWGWADYYSGGTPIAEGNIIRNNKIYGVMKISNTGGAIYTLGKQTGMKIYNNYMYDLGIASYALFRDQGSAGIIDTNNVVDGGTSTSGWYGAYTIVNPNDVYDTHDNSSYLNYYSYGMTMKINARNMAIRNTPAADGVWPAEAQAIMQNAGVSGSSENDPQAYFIDLTGTQRLGVWNLDEAAGYTAANEFAGGPAGTVSGNAEWSSGKLQNGLKLASDGALTIHDPRAVLDFSVALWVKLDALPAAGLQNIVAKTSAGASVISHQLAVDPQGRVHARLSGTESKEIISTDTLAPGKWYHLALTAGSKDALRLYINGAEQASAALSGMLWNDSSQQYVAGRISAAAPGIEGTVDQLKMYGSILTAMDLQVIYETEYGLINLALSKTATASSSYNSFYLADNAIDGNLSTRWAAAAGRTGGEWLKVDLQQEYAIQEIRAVIDNAGKTIEYKFEYSTDDSTWHPFGEASYTTQKNHVYAVVDAPVTARYVRMTIINSSGFGCSIFELGIYETRLERTYNLAVGDLHFAAQQGYTPQARPITIVNLGNANAHIAAVTVDSEAFTIGGSGGFIEPGGTMRTWNVQPAADLKPGTYTGTITVTYDGGKTAQGRVRFTVTPVKENVALSASGASAAASSHYTLQPGYTADMAIDGDLGTRWAAEAGRLINEWIIVTLPQEKRIDEIRVVTEPAHVKYQVAYSRDGIHWNILVPPTETDVADNHYLLSAPVTAKYVKLTFVDSFGQGCSVRELAVYEAIAPAASSGAGPEGTVLLPREAMDAARQLLEELKKKWPDLSETERHALLKEARRAVAGTVKEMAREKLSVSVSEGKAVPIINTARLAAVAKAIKTAADDLNGELELLGGKPAKTELTLDLGTVEADAAEIALNKALLDQLAEIGIEGLAVAFNDVEVVILPDTLPEGAGLHIAKRTLTGAEGIPAGAAASGAYDIEFVSGGETVTRFKTPAELRIRVQNAENYDPELLTLAKIDGNRLIYYMGKYDPGIGMVRGRRDSLSAYVVVEHKLSFDDLAPVQSWAERFIEAAAAKGIIVGDRDGRFRPNDRVTHAEFVIMLAAAVGLTGSGMPAHFVDVKEGDWFHPYVSAAVEAGIAEGRTAWHFSPNEPITRQEMAYMTGRVLVMAADARGAADAEAVLGVFADAAEIASRYKSDIAVTVNEQVMVGAYGRLHPHGYATRAEAAVVIKKLIDLLE